MKTKKCGAYAALAAVLLISAVLITNCVDPLNPGGLLGTQKGQQEDFTPPPGMGYVMLNFGAGRTIRPDSADFIDDVEDFSHFDVVFTATSGGTSDNTTGLDMTYQELTETPFLLATGTYTIEVYAYDDVHTNNDHNKAVAYGAVTGVAVANGAGTPGTITLKEITTTTHGGKGTFSWVLVLGGSRTELAELTLTPYPSGSAIDDFNPKDITSDLTNTAELDPGIYAMTIVLSGAKSKTATIREVLHIYQGMTSNYGVSGTPITLPAINRNVYNVTYTYDDTRADDGKSMDGSQAAEEVNHGDLVTQPSGGLEVNQDDDDMVLEGWYTESAKTNKWVFTTQLIKDLTLFAKWHYTGTYITVEWNRPTGTEPVITIHEVTLNDDDPPTIGPSVTPTSISRNHPQILRFQAPTSGYSAYSWSVSTTTQTSTASYIDVDFSGINLKILGPTSIILTATPTAGGGESASVDITVTDTP